MSHMLSAQSLQQVLPIPMTLPASLESASVARRVLRTALDGLLAADLLADVEVMVGELVANAVTISGSVCAVQVTMPSPEILRVSVSDFDRSDPQLRTPHPLEEHGRGLRLVDALALRWGSDATPPFGKTVWFEVAVSAAA